MKTVLRRGYTRIIAGATAVGLVAAGCLLLARPAAVSSGQARAAAAAAAAGGALQASAPPGALPHAATSAANSLAQRYAGATASFAACEQRVESASETSVPRLVAVGASFTAGMGAGSAGRSWAVVLARMLGADAVVSGVSGAGYVRAGAWQQGPVGAELARLGLRAIRPGLVIVQAGHNDIGEPASIVRQQVTRVIALIHAEAPGARIALITVFPGHAPLSAAVRTDRAIISAATAASRGVIILDPLAGRWTYQRASDGLHPTAAGDAAIARDVAAGLRARGVAAGMATGGSPVICVNPGAQPGPDGKSLNVSTR